MPTLQGRYCWRVGSHGDFVSFSHIYTVPIGLSKDVRDLKTVLSFSPFTVRCYSERSIAVASRQSVCSV